ncbi:MAG: hypothetical protein Q4F56_00430 [Candidatus Saccharibacteria bacterium]|nr:hypothetical protein [Candidatus Saccharibacteria bacterium]
MDNNSSAEQVKASRKKKIKGGTNLVILGVASVLIAATTTGISLAIYHNSGDIYIDRSRPGYLPDEEEIEDEEGKELEYRLDRTGKMNIELVEEYLENLGFEVKAIDTYEKPFNQEVLTDEHLGIPLE